MNSTNTTIEEIESLLDEIYRFKSTSKAAQENINSVFELLGSLKDMKPVYQVQLITDQNTSAWRDATEEAYHTFMPERRRIINIL